MKRTHRLKRWSLNEGVLLLGALPAVQLYLTLARGKFLDLVPMALGLLAVSIALTSLMYSRSRAYSSKIKQRRSLIASEVLFRAVLFLLLSITASLLINYAVPVEAYIAGPVIETGTFGKWFSQFFSGLGVLFLIPCYLFLFSYLAVWDGLRIALRGRWRVVPSHKSLRRFL